MSIQAPNSNPTVELTGDVFAALAHPIAFDIFRLIADNGPWQKENLIKQMNNKPSRKQFYDNIRRLKKAGLVRRELNKYRLSGFGKVVAQGMNLIEKGAACFWPINFLENMHSRLELPDNKFYEMIKKVIHDEEMRRIVFGNDCQVSMVND
jgi:hypothetical protein